MANSSGSSQLMPMAPRMPAAPLLLEAPPLAAAMAASWRLRLRLPFAAAAAVLDSGEGTLLMMLFTLSRRFVGVLDLLPICRYFLGTSSV